jgi:hypothetical protein
MRLCACIAWFAAVATSASDLRERLQALEAIIPQINDEIDRAMASASLATCTLFEGWAARDAADKNRALESVVASLEEAGFDLHSNVGGIASWKGLLPERQEADALAAATAALRAAQT